MFPDELNERLFVLALLLTVITLLFAFFANPYFIVLSILIVIGFGVYFYIQKKNEPYKFTIEHSDVDLIINDERGFDVTYGKKEKVRALKNNVFTITDLYNCDGIIDPHSIKVKPGRINSIRSETGDLYIETHLEKEFHKGDIIERELKMNFRESFMNDREFWNISQFHPSCTQTLTITFPETRNVESYRVKELKGQYEL